MIEAELLQLSVATQKLEHAVEQLKNLTEILEEEEAPHVPAEVAIRRGRSHWVVLPLEDGEAEARFQEAYEAVNTAVYKAVDEVFAAAQAIKTHCDELRSDSSG